MTEEPVFRLICLFSVGLALLLAGGVNACFHSARASLRILFSCLAAGCVLVGCWMLTDNLSLLLQAAGLTALVLTATVLAGSSRVMHALSALLRSSRQPRVRWGLVSAFGLATIVGSIFAFERQDEQSINAAMLDLDDMAAAPPMKEIVRVRATTDRGNRVILREVIEPKSDTRLDEIEQRVLNTNSVKNQLIRQQAATEQSNCHGWVFTGGRYWVLGAEVEAILAENDYKSVEKPQPGDLVIYRDKNGVSHSCVVRYVTDGLPVMVEGKWGQTGVYLHAVDQSCYGSNFTYYRSSRNGHLLAGLSDPTSNEPGRNAASE